MFPQWKATSPQEKRCHRNTSTKHSQTYSICMQIGASFWTWLQICRAPSHISFLSQEIILLLLIFGAPLELEAHPTLLAEAPSHEARYHSRTQQYTYTSHFQDKINKLHWSNTLSWTLYFVRLSWYDYRLPKWKRVRNINTFTLKRHFGDKRDVLQWWKRASPPGKVIFRKTKGSFATSGIRTPERKNQRTHDG